MQNEITNILSNIDSRNNSVLTVSEKQFKLDAINNNITDVIKKINPTVYIWENNDGILTKLKSSRKVYCDCDYDNEEYHKNKNILDQHDGLRDKLKNYLLLIKKVDEKRNEIRQQFKMDISIQDNYDFNLKLNYATNGTMDSLIRQFGYYDGDDCNPMIL